MIRKKVAFLVCDPLPKFNIQAFKYFILSLNHFQNQYETNFPDVHDYFLTKDHENGEKTINGFHDFISSPRFKHINRNYDYWIIIASTHINGNLFSVSIGNISIVTTFGWEKYFSPPSIFEYLLNSTVSCLLFMEKDLRMISHKETYGCVLDYTRIKQDDRVDIAMGYICDEDRKMILKNKNVKYLNDIQFIISRKWIGTVNDIHSIAYNLKHYFKFDIEKDSGLKKSFWQKSIDSLSDLPKEFLIILFGTIISILLFIIGINTN
jgi:hypothetical protein